MSQLRESAGSVILNQTALPVLADVDLLVTGGSMGGVSAALAAAVSGLRVMLVEPRTYLGRELTACLRPWVSYPPDLQPPSLLASCIQAAGVPFPDLNVIVFKMGELKTALEDCLLEAGVRLLYASQPMQLCEDARHVSGVVIGNKSGRQVIRAARVIDATETGLLLQLAGAQSSSPSGAGQTAVFYRTLEFDKLGDVSPGPLKVPESLSSSIRGMRLVPGAGGEGHWLVECALSLPAIAPTSLERTAREIEARQRTMAAAAYLRRYVSGFERAVLASASQLLYSPSEPAAPADAPLSSLYVINPGPLNHPDEAAWAACAAGEALGRRLAREESPPVVLPAPSIPSAEPTRALAQDNTLAFLEPDSPQRGKAYPRQPVPAQAVPLMREVDVLVVGGGTSGATAAYAAAKNGARTLLLEAGPGLGGTGTLGGVHSYWFGRRAGYSQQVIQAVQQAHVGLGLEPPEGALLKWNIEAKMHALLGRALDAGVEMVWGAVAAGALMEGRCVRGVVAATPLGPVAVRASVVIDATGDGDVAYFAGAPSVYGSERDHVTMWYSLAQFYRPGITKNNFTSMVDVGNVEDLTRAVLSGRRRLVQGYHDAGAYVAPRESRHILADVVLTLNDQLLKRCWPDVVYVAFSNHDVKGHSTSDWLRIGLIPPNLEVEIPYRALLPRGLEGILVAGKAFSATHDALPAVRMQPDLENLGGVVGTAAALAVQSGCLPRQVNIERLQRLLVAEGVLPESVMNRGLRPRRCSRADLEDLTQAASAAPPLHTYQDMDLDVVFEGRIPFVDCCTAGPEVVPVLVSAYHRAQSEQRLLLAKALAMVGSSAGVDALVQGLHDLTPGEGLQPLDAHIRYTQLPPDHGAMPEAAHLLYALGMVRDARALLVWDHFSMLIAEMGEKNLRDRALGLFYYVDAVCFGAERLGDSRAVPALRRIHASPLFHNRSSSAAYEADYFLERQSYLELVIARALARCGDRQGCETLIAYLEDSRALLAEHAHSELRALAGEDFGKQPESWRRWLAGARLRPVPLDDTREAVQAWGQEILTCNHDP